MAQKKSEKFIIETTGVEALVTRRKVKRLSMTVKPPDGSVHITAPLFMTAAAVKEFMESHISWILSKQELCRRRAEAAPDTAADSVMLWGNAVPLTVIPGAAHPSAAVENGTVVLRVTADSHEQRSMLLEELFAAQLQERLPAVIEKCERITGVHATQWKLRYMKTRWGSCTTTTGHIRLNTRLAVLPPECLDYVVTHELCHLHEPSHNARFYSLMDGFFPGWRNIRARMKDMSGAVADKG